MKYASIYALKAKSATQRAFIQAFVIEISLKSSPPDIALAERSVHLPIAISRGQMVE
jgi:hypothetical protein